jgi:hypothetical protein
MLCLELFLNWKLLKFSEENSGIYLKNGQKFVLVRLVKSYRSEFMHEQALLVATSNFLLRYGFFYIRRRVFVRNFDFFFGTMSKNCFISSG